MSLRRALTIIASAIAVLVLSMAGVGFITSWLPTSPLDQHQQTILNLVVSVIHQPPQLPSSSGRDVTVEICPAVSKADLQGMAELPRPPRGLTLMGPNAGSVTYSFEGDPLEDRVLFVSFSGGKCAAGIAHRNAWL